MSVEDEVACRDVVELLTDYLEGALPPDLRARIDAHLGACDGCTSALEQMRETIRLSGQLPPEQVPEPEREALRAAFRDWREAQPDPPRA